MQTNGCFYWIKLRERTLEEALKDQGKFIQQLIQQMKNRFDQMDQRFIELQHRMDRFMFRSRDKPLAFGRLIAVILKFWTIPMAASPDNSIIFF